MGDDAQGTPADALETTEGAALAAEIVERLEAELVRFCHRVTHDHGIELDRARAAMVLLGKLVASGTRWTARSDSMPTRIHESFTQLLPRYPALAPIIRRELGAFFVATVEVVVADDDLAMTPGALLRRAGAAPQLWWWAADFAQPETLWAGCGADVGKLIQVALAFGVSADRVGRALAATFGLVATRVKTRYAAQRNNLVAVLLRISSAGAAALKDQELVATITKLAFEMTAAQQAWWKDQRATPDGLADISIHSFQLVELLQAAARPPDLERFGALVSRAARTFHSRGLQLDVMLHKELDEYVAHAIAQLFLADG
ncbi:MAG: hypothetical protein H6Q90_4 [Deltaproteobacteria bacterium]|nr:hypothetical protein [Deltaproteobacteria bacterium]